MCIPRYSFGSQSYSAPKIKTSATKPLTSWIRSPFDIQQEAQNAHTFGLNPKVGAQRLYIYVRDVVAINPTFHTKSRASSTQYPLMKTYWQPRLCSSRSCDQDIARLFCVHLQTDLCFCFLTFFSSVKGPIRAWRINDLTEIDPLSAYPYSRHILLDAEESNPLSKGLEYKKHPLGSSILDPVICFIHPFAPPILYPFVRSIAFSPLRITYTLSLSSFPLPRIYLPSFLLLFLLSVAVSATAASFTECHPCQLVIPRASSEGCSTIPLHILPIQRTSSIL